jgi:hypothetical protein
MSAARVHLLTLSERTSAKGNEYLSGWLGRASVVAFRGEPDKWGNDHKTVCHGRGEYAFKNSPRSSTLATFVASPAGRGGDDRPATSGAEAPAGAVTPMS